jgi:hypothetical protein
MQDGNNISCGITMETAFVQKNRVENTILAKLLQNTELALNSRNWRENLTTAYDNDMISAGGKIQIKHGGKY